MPKIDHVPPQSAVDHAIEEARKSPCQKSKRGVVIFHRTGGLILGAGFNSQPNGACDGTCHNVCGKVCVHAETRAIRVASFHRYGLAECDALHVKVNEAGELVTSDRPKCYQCSVQVVDAQLDGFWLYRRTGWHRYTAATFHRLSLIAHGLIRDAHLACQRCSLTGILCVCEDGPLT